MSGGATFMATGTMVGVGVGIAVAAVVIGSFAIPTLKGVNTSTWSTSETTLWSLGAISLILIIVGGGLRAAGFL
jgi:hypothetical protein